MHGARHERAPGGLKRADARDPWHRRPAPARRERALIGSLIPGAQVEIFDGVGHMFFWERPQRAAELISAHARVPV